MKLLPCKGTLRAAVLLLSTAIDAAAADAPRLSVPGITGKDNRITNELHTPPWSAIGRLNITTGGFCTASVVGPRQVLTAAHCLWNKRTARWFPPCALHFLASYRRGDYAVHALVADVHIGQGFSMQGKRRLGSDWAIITLDRVVSHVTGVLELSSDSLHTGDALVQAGYSRDRPHVLTVDRTCRVRRAAQTERLLTHDCDATFGDSGSPILRQTDDGYRLAGIHTALRRDGRQIEGVAVTAQAFAAWLHNHPVTRPPGGVKACQAPTGGSPDAAVQWTAEDRSSPWYPVVHDR